MIKTINAHTFEIDDIDIAVNEILNQIKIEENLLANTVGILTCHHEFVLSGAIKAICAALPFEVVGLTTSRQSLPDVTDGVMLALTVITSDDTNFKTVYTDTLKDDAEKPISDAYSLAVKDLPEKPKIIFAFAPLMHQHAGDSYIDILDKLSGGVPIFGSLPIEAANYLDLCYTIFNGECERDKFAMILCSGNINPKCYMASVMREDFFARNLLITSSVANKVKEINGRPFIDFLEELDIAENGAIKNGISFVVFLVNYNDGSKPIGRVLLALDEEGNGFCGGFMPEGANISATFLTREDVIDATKKLMEKVILENPENQNFLCFSCLTRNVALGTNQNKEFEEINKALSGKQYMACLSGGEICPDVLPDGTNKNRFHNNTIIICSF